MSSASEHSSMIKRKSEAASEGRTKPSSKQYRDNWSKIFKKKK
jgi:hypothetical protein